MLSPISPTDYFLLGLKKTLYPDIHLPSPPDLKEVHKLAVAHALSGLLYYAYQDIDDVTVDRFKKDCQFTAVRMMKQRALVEEAIIPLKAQNVPIVPLKGYVLNELYPYPDMRQMGDVDLLIQESDFPKVRAVMKAQRYAFKDDFENTFNCYKYPLLIEWHVALFADKDASYKAYFKNVFDYVTEDTLQKEMHLAFMVAHAAKHFLGYGFGMRGLFDFAVYLKAYDDVLDHAALKQHLEALKLNDFYETLLSAIDVWFSVKSRYSMERVIDDETLNQLKQFIIQCGAFGFSESNKMEAVAIAVATGKNKTSIRKGRIRAILRKVFPRLKTLNAQYPYTKKYSILIPYAFICRLLKIVFKRKDAKRRIKELFSDQDDIKDIITLYQRVGLLDNE